MDPTRLTLAAVAALAVAGVARRGSPNKMSPVQKRLLYVAKTFSPTVTVLTGDIILANDDYFGSPWLIKSDFEELGKDPKPYLKELIESDEWYDGETLSQVDQAVAPLIPWIAKEINRILKKRFKDPLKSVPARDVGYRARWSTNLTLEGVEALMSLRDNAPRSWSQDTSGAKDLVYKGKNLRGYMPSFTIPVVSDTFGALNLTARDFLQRAHLKRLVKAFPLIRDWYGSGEAGDIGRLTYQEADAAQKRWHRSLRSKTPGGELVKASTRGTVVAPLSGGWKIERLAVGDLRPQSKAMGHCVGRVSGYAQGVRSGATDILSVRNDKDRSVFTLELSLRGTPRLIQFKGNGNRIPGLTVSRTKRHGGESVEEMRESIERARKPFVIQSDLKRAKEVMTALHQLYGRFDDDRNSDLLVLFATNTLPSR
jgi:hypothetical protein